MTLHIHSLGPFFVRHERGQISDSGWKTQKNKTLFKLLITYRGHALTKEQLWEWIWPDLHPAAASRDLRVAISYLRQLLEPALPHGSHSSYILTSDAGYAWNTAAPVWLDAAVFEQLAQRRLAVGSEHNEPDTVQELEAALDLYQGDFLEEDRYSDWALNTRERLRELSFVLRLQLAERYARQGLYQRPILLCRDILAVDHCREDVWRRLMLFYYHAGDQARAQRAFAECRATLARELGVEPLPETADLFAQIQRRVVGGDQYPLPSDIERIQRLPVSLGRIAFVGREEEFAWLVDHATHAWIGRGRVVVIEGEAGVGKTRLAEELGTYARQHHVSMLQVHCREEAQSTPFAVLYEALPGLAHALATLPPYAHLPLERQKTLLFAALMQVLLAHSGVDQPAYLLLDDVQWADPAMLEFLDYFAANMQGARVLIVSTFRSEEVATDLTDTLGTMLWALQRRGALHRLKLGPLGQAAVTRLLQTVGRTHAGTLQLGQQLYAETEGHPLFLVSVLQTLFEEGVITVTANGVWTVSADALPQRDLAHVPATIQQAVAHRLQRLAREECQVLEAAAVLGNEFQWTTLVQMRTWRRDVLFDRLDRLKHAMLIAEQGRTVYTFTHEKIRQVVYDTLAPDERCWLHQKAGEALEIAQAEQLDAIAGILAYHFAQAQLPERAWRYRVRAGWHATKLYAHSEAKTQFQAALALVGREDFQPPPSEIMEVHAALGGLYQASGQFLPAAEHFNAALTSATDAAVRVRYLYQLAHNYDRQGQHSMALQLLATAVDDLDRNGADQVGLLEASRIYARWAIINSGDHGYVGAEHYARCAMTLLEEHRLRSANGQQQVAWAEYDAIHTALINAGEAFRHWARWSIAAVYFGEALAVAERQSDLIGIGYACHNLGDVLLAQGQVDEACARYEQAVDSFTRSQQRWEEMASRTHLGLAWACAGRWTEALGCLEQAQQVGETLEPTAWLAELYLWLALGQLQLHANRAQARVFLGRAQTIATALGQSVPHDVWLLVQSRMAAHATQFPAANKQFVEGAALLANNTARAIYSQWLLRQLAPQA